MQVNYVCRRLQRYRRTAGTAALASPAGRLAHGGRVCSPAPAHLQQQLCCLSFQHIHSRVKLRHRLVIIPAADRMSRQAPSEALTLVAKGARSQQASWWQQHAWLVLAGRQGCAMSFCACSPLGCHRGKRLALLRQQQLHAPRACVLHCKSAVASFLRTMAQQWWNG